MIRIKFKTREDSINGYYELAISGIVRSLPNDIFEISNEGKIILDNAGIPYEIIEMDEVLDEIKAIRNSLTVSI